MPGKAKFRKKQEKFVTQFMKHREPTRAAQEAGYKDASHTAARLLASEDIQRQIEERTQEGLAANGISKLTMDGVGNVFFLGQIVRVIEYGMQEVEPKDRRGKTIYLKDGETPAFELRNPKMALEGLGHLGRYLGVYKDKVEVTGSFDFSALEEARRRVLAASAATPGVDWEAEVVEDGQPEEC